MKIHGNIEAVLIVAVVILAILYPWMKIHGNIEARRNWPPCWRVAEYPWMKIHGNIEAHRCHVSFIITHQYPWMKIHGNIEAEMRGIIGKIHALYPWMKIHGNIEARMQSSVLQAFVYCIHGWKSMATLKQIIDDRLFISREQVSMDENPWQHWSNSTNLGFVPEKPSIHGWKSMATLKHKALRKVDRFHCLYPWMKIHGNIEAKH